MLGTTLGSYRLVSEIGQGGMGVVYLAQHVLLGKRAAVKVLLPDMSRDAVLVERFFNEARAVATIRHPGIVEVFDFGHHTDGSAYIVMEHLEGESLAWRLSSEQQPPLAFVLAVTRQVASALHAAHEQGIVHRDLKPENIFLVRDADAPAGVRAKVLDFGIAKLARPEEPRSVKTKTGAVFGTPRYMSPEQCKNAANVDRRADVYALGCIVYEMVVGSAPFDYDNWGELVAAHIHETPLAPRAKRPDLPEVVDELIRRALAKKLDDRYGSMAELAHEVERAWVHETGRPFSTTLPPVSRAAAIGEPRPIVTQAPTMPANGEITGATLLAPGRRGWLIAAGVLVAAGALVMYLQLRGESEPAAEPSADPTPVRAPAPPPLAPAPALVHVVIDSQPHGADVYRAADGVNVGKTPYEHDYERTTGEVELIVKLAGYRDARVRMPVDKDGTSTTTMQRLREPVRAKPKPKPKQPGGPTVLDPYGDGT